MPNLTVSRIIGIYEENENVSAGEITITPVKCATCKFWGLISYNRSGWHRCTNVEYDYGGKARAYHDGAFSSEFHTAPDFGCVLWSAKDDKEN